MKTGKNSEVLNYLYYEIYPKVKAYICSNSGTEDDALDIFQDGLMSLCKQIKMGKFDIKYDLAGFLYVVCRNLWINKAKYDSRMKPLSDYHEEIESHDFSNDIVTDQKERILKSLLSKLGQKCLELLQYSVYYNKSHEEICELMGFATVNSVKTQKYKCKQKLLKLLESHPYYNDAIE